MADPVFLKIPDVVAILNVSPRVVRTLLHSGELRGIQIGGRGQWRVDVAEVDAYIARQYETSKAAAGCSDLSAGEIVRDRVTVHVRAAGSGDSRA